MQWLDWDQQPPTLDDADVFGFVLCRRLARPGQPWYEARPTTAAQNDGWQWLQGAGFGAVVRIDTPKSILRP